MEETIIFICLHLYWGIILLLGSKENEHAKRQSNWSYRFNKGLLRVRLVGYARFNALLASFIDISTIKLER